MYRHDGKRGGAILPHSLPAGDACSTCGRAKTMIIVAIHPSKKREGICGEREGTGSLNLGYDDMIWHDMLQ